MLKRAYISAVIAAIAAIFGFSGLLDGAAPIAKGISYAFAAFSGLSFLFSLFEDVSEPPPPAVVTSQGATPQLVFTFAGEPALSPMPAH